MDKRELEKRLRAIREPAPPADLGVRLEHGVPDFFRRPESWWSAGRVWTMAKYATLAAAAAAAAWFVVGLFTVGPGTVNVVFAEVLAPVAEATGQPRAVHLELRMLTREQESFSYVNLAGDLQPVRVWLQGPLHEGDKGRARLEKPGRILVFDGQESTLYFVSKNEAIHNVGFDAATFWPVEWLQQIRNTPVEGVEVLAFEERHGEGRMLLRAKGASPAPLEPSFFDEFDRETEVVWDLETHRLKSMRRWVYDKGDRRLFAELTSIEYRDAFDEAVFRIDLPADVRWMKKTEGPLPPEHVGLGPKEVARRIFEAAMQHDRKTLEFYIDSPGLVDWFMTHDIELVALGESFQTDSRAAHFVPYEVRVRWGGIFHYTTKGNLALRNDNPEQRWEFDGGW